MSRRVILYELNEVPWYIIDYYTERRPASALSTLLSSATSLTTLCEDPEPLQPWRTWPDFHNSAYTPEHQSYDLGQDPASFRGIPMWRAAEEADKVIGLFGPFQSWPAREPSSGGFYVPDTFARSSETVPAELGRFQAFNLAMTQDNTFNPEGQLSPLELLRVGTDLVRLGLTARSASAIAWHLVSELRDSRAKASRSVMQALPSFDLYWKLHRDYAPDLSIFFTNHVAGMMHRYWGDGVPEYESSSQYRADPVFATFLVKAMDVFDHQLARILTWMRHRPDVLLIVASSMGQFAIDKEDVDETYVLDKPDALMTKLGTSQAQVGSAMYPRTSFLFESQAEAQAAVQGVESVVTDGGPLFGEVRVVGRTLSFAIDQQSWGRPRTHAVTYRMVGEDRERDGHIHEIGVSIRRRMGGGNTAYHVPEGIFIAHGTGIKADKSRREVSVLDAAPSILEAMNVPIPEVYAGKASISLC